MEASDVVVLQRLLSERRLDWWIVGGWGVDAILGRETRSHKDLDVLIPVHHLPQIRDLLASLEYRLTLLWEENRWLPGEDGVPDAGRATVFVLTDSIPMAGRLMSTSWSHRRPHRAALGNGAPGDRR